MAREESSKVRTIRSQTDERNRQRLKRDLGMNDDAVDVIMNLRSQVISLQARLRELESLVEIYHTESDSRLTRYRQVYYEAVWEDIIENNQ